MLGGSPKRCEIWGVLNVTPDSFSDGGEAMGLSAAFEKAKRLVAEGADVIDVGGASSRPAGDTYGQGAAVVSVEEELRRVVPVIEKITRELKVRVSIDTFQPEVACAALAAGASIVNDISMGRSDALLETVAAHESALLVLMHNRGDGRVSGENIAYRDVVDDVRSELSSAAVRASASGIRSKRVWLDPGIGFAKTSAQSVTLLARLPQLLRLGYPVLVGPSRKSFIAELEKRSDLAPAPPPARLGGTLAAVSLCAWLGASAVRVHDVAASRQALLVTEAIAAARAREGVW